jgi:putative membrane protein
MDNNWYSGFGWLIWYGIFLLFFFNMGNWGYTYRAHRRLRDGQSGKTALEILNERLARGDLSLEKYLELKVYICSDSVDKEAVSARKVSF